MDDRKHLDLRVRRSRAAIRSAVSALMSERALEDVTAKDVADRALIHKKTFYGHYPSVRAVVDELEDEAVREVGEVLREGCVTSLDGLAMTCERLRSLASDGATAFGSIVGTSMWPELLLRLRRALSGRLARLASLPGIISSSVSRRLAQAADFVAGGTVALLASWLTGDFDATARDVAETLASALSTYEAQVRTGVGDAAPAGDMSLFDSEAGGPARGRAEE